MASQENQAAAETSRSEGNEFFKKKQVDEAIAAYTKSIDLSPDSSNAALCYSNRSACHQMKKNWKEMEADAAKCTKLKPTFAKGYTRLALAFRKQGNFMGAVKCLKDALPMKGNEDNEELKKALDDSKAKFEKFVRDSNENSGGSSANTTANALSQIFQAEYQKAQQKYGMTRRSLAETNMELDQSAKSKKTAELTMREVKSLDTSSHVYRSVGKVYIASTVQSELNLLERESNEATDRTAGLEKKKEILGRQLKSCENEITELVKSIRSGRA